MLVSMPVEACSNSSDMAVAVARGGLVVLSILRCTVVCAPLNRAEPLFVWPGDALSWHRLEARVHGAGYRTLSWLDLPISGSESDWIHGPVLPESIADGACRERGGVLRARGQEAARSLAGGAWRAG